MTRKRPKVRAKHQQGPGEKNDSSDDDDSPMPGKRCPHLSKAINISGIKKALKNASSAFGECQQCHQTKEGMGDADVPVDTSVWMCLQCGHQGCGRMSPPQHALHHYKTPHSDMHDVVVNTATWSIWCYSCDEEVPQGACQKLMDCIEFIRKHLGMRKTRMSPSPSGSCFSRQQEVETCIVEEPLGSADAKEGALKFMLKANKPSAHSNVELQKVKGLANMGNTCFFNAVMQNLNQTHQLHQLVEEHISKDGCWNIPQASICNDTPVSERNGCISKHEEEEEQDDLKVLEVPLFEPGPLTQALHGFLKDMSSPSKNSVVNPSHLFGQICKKSPQFRGFQQQDSHELLRHLLDGIKTEEVKRQRKGVLHYFKLDEKVNPKNVDEDTKAKIKGYKHQTTHTIIDSIFGGQLISTVMCDECHKPSQIFEPFMDLSLPVAEEKTVRPGHQRRLTPEEPLGTCFGKNHESKENEAPSKYQEKKQKRQAKRDAKRKAKSEKRAAALQIVPLQSEKASTATNGEQKDDDYESGDNINLTDADVEDNDESETISSHHSRASSKTTNEIEATVAGAWTDAASISSRETMNQDFNDLGDASNTSGYCDSSSIMSLSMLADSNGELKASEADMATSNLQIEELCNRVANLPDLVQDIPGVVAHCNGKEDCGAEVSEGARNVVREWSAKSRTTLAPRYQPSSRECSVMSCLNHFSAPELLTGNNKFGCENCTRIKAEKTQQQEGKTEMVYCNASKQLLIFSPPAILTLHLKRFQQVGFSLRKVNQYVEFPLLLDLAPFCSSICLGLPHVPSGCRRVLYSLYGVVEHSGRLTGGHYTAYVKVRPPRAIEASGKFLSRHPLEDTDVDRWLEKAATKCEAAASHRNEKGGADANDVEVEVPPGKWYHISDSHVTEVSEDTVKRCQAYLLFYERLL